MKKEKYFFRIFKRYIPENKWEADYLIGKENARHATIGDGIMEMSVNLLITAGIVTLAWYLVKLLEITCY